MKLINLTPHEINIIKFNSTECLKTISTNVQGIIARCKVETKLIDDINYIPIYETKLSEVENLPEQKNDVMYIVSRAVANKSDRDDLLIPNQVVRDHKGKILGCRSLAKVGK